MFEVRFNSQGLVGFLSRHKHEFHLFTKRMISDSFLILLRELSHTAPQHAISAASIYPDIAAVIPVPLAPSLFSVPTVVDHMAYHLRRRGKLEQSQDTPDATPAWQRNVMLSIRVLKTRQHRPCGTRVVYCCC